MTFDYYSFDDNYIIKEHVNIDKEEIKRLYRYFFELYSHKKTICIKTKEKFYVKTTKDVIIVNYDIIKLEDEDMYQISYEIYNYPKICYLINRLCNEETFKEGYEYLKKSLLSTQQSKIEEKRSKLNREIIQLNVGLKNANITESLGKIQLLEKEIESLFQNFDIEFAKDAEKVFSLLKITTFKTFIGEISKKDKNYVKTKN